MKHFFVSLLCLTTPVLAQVKTLSYGTNGIAIFSAGTNPLTFTSPLSPIATPPLVFPTETSLTNFKSAISLDRYEQLAIISEKGNYTAARISSGFPEAVVNIEVAENIKLTAGLGAYIELTSSQSNPLITSGADSANLDWEHNGRFSSAIIQGKNVVYIGEDFVFSPEVTEVRENSIIFRYPETGIKQTGNDGILRFVAADAERANLKPSGDLTLLPNGAAFSFSAANTNGPGQTRTNLQLTFSALTNTNSEAWLRDLGLLNIDGGYSLGGIGGGGGSVTIGSGARVSFGGEAIQIGTGTNSTENSVQFGNSGAIPYTKYAYIAQGTTIGMGLLTNATASAIRSYIGITPDIMMHWAIKDAANYPIISAQTGLGVVTGNLLVTNIGVTNPSGQPYPFYRLSTGISPATRTNSDSALIRSGFAFNYFAGRTRGKINWTNPLTIFFRMAAPLWPTGAGFQFGIGYNNGTPVLLTTTNAAIPTPSDIGIGFRLVRTNAPAAGRVDFFFKPATNVAVSNIATTNLLSNVSDVKYLKFAFLPGTPPQLILSEFAPDGSEIIVATTGTNLTGVTFGSTANTHHVNWAAGVTVAPTTLTNVDIDIEPPLILQ